MSSLPGLSCHPPTHQYLPRLFSWAQGTQEHTPSSQWKVRILLFYSDRTWMYLAPLTQASRLSVPEIMSAWALAVSFPLRVPASSNWSSSSRMSWHQVTRSHPSSSSCHLYLDRLVDLGLVHIVQDHTEALAGKDHCPALANESRAHNTNFLIFILSHVWRERCSRCSEGSSNNVFMTCRVTLFHEFVVIQVQINNKKQKTSVQYYNIQQFHVW